MTPEGTERDSRNAYYIRASARNEWQTTARQCRAFLETIEKEVEPGHYRIIHHSPLPLTWAYLGVVAVDIFPGTEYFFDIFNVNEQDNRLVPNTPVQPHVWKTLLQETARYRFTAYVAGENMPKKTVSVAIDWRGKFDSIREDSFS